MSANWLRITGVFLSYLSSWVLVESMDFIIASFQVYWFIVEFGLCREDGRLKAIGAGLLSAYGELQHACSDVPDHKDFDPVVTAVQKYEDDDYQPLYFVANNIQDALIKLRCVMRRSNRVVNRFGQVLVPQLGNSNNISLLLIYY